MRNVGTFGDRVLPGAAQSLKIARDAGLVLIGSLLIAVGAKLTVPLLPVPVTFQGFAVVLVAALLGRRRGTLAALAYLGEGALGLPVFALPVAGPAYFFGPTAGYLLAFPAAAWVAGALTERGWDRRFVTALCALAIGQALILAGGFLWLSRSVGVSAAFATGVAPFLIGDLLKSALAATALPAGWRLVGSTGRRT